MGETFLWGKRKCHWQREIRTASNKQNWRTIRQIVRENRRLTVRSIAEQANVDRETVRKTLTEDLDMKKVCAKGPKGAHRRTKTKKSHNLPRPFGEARWHFGPCHRRWWNMDLPVRPWNEAAKCTMEDCQFPTTKKIKIRRSKSRVKTMLLTFFILEGLFIMNLHQLGQRVN